MSKQIGLRHLRHFLAMCEHKSMTRAAEALNTVQPALSRSLRELESSLETPLFHRTPQGMILTPAGKDLIQYVEGPLLQIRDGMARIKGLPEKATVTISIAPAISRILGVRVLKAYAQQFPQVHLEVEARLYSDSVKYVRDGTVDFSVGRLLMPEDLGGLSFEHLFVEPIVFATHASHPLAKKAGVTLQDINAFQVVVPMQYAIIRREIEKYMIRRGVREFDRTLDTTSYELARSYVRETDAVACLSRSILLPELLSGEFVALDIPVDDMMGAVGITYRSTGRLSHPAQALFNMFRDHAHAVYA